MRARCGVVKTVGRLSKTLSSPFCQCHSTITKLAASISGEGPLEQVARSRLSSGASSEFSSVSPGPHETNQAILCSCVAGTR